MYISKLMIIVTAIITFGANAALKPADMNPAVTVVWDNPDDYRDVDVADGIQKRYQARVLDNFEKYFHKVLPKYLQENQKIKVIIYDVDLAGDVRPMIIQGRDVRLVTSIYPPMMDLEYVITDSDGNVVKTMRKRLHDIGFNVGGSGFSGQALRYEKVMIKRWLRKELQ